MPLPHRQYFKHFHNYGIACLSEMLSPLWRLLLIPLRIKKASPPTEWKKGVLIGANHIGDILCLTASLRQLKLGTGVCQWDIVVGPPANEVVNGNPNIKTVFNIPHERNFFNLWSKVRPKLLDQKYDVVICYDQGSSWVDLLLSLSLRIPNRVGYVHKGFSSLWTFPILLPPHYPTTIANCFRYLVSQVTGIAPTWSLRPEVNLRPEDKVEAQSFLRHVRMDDGPPPYLCFISSRQKHGVPPPALLIKIVAELVTLDPRPLVLSGSRNEAELLQRYAFTFPVPTYVEAGELSLRGLVSFMGYCQAVICPDSGPRRLATSAGSRVYYFRNIWFDRRIVGSDCENEFDLVGNEHLISPKDESGVWEKYPPRAIAETIFLSLTKARRPPDYSIRVNDTLP